WSSDGKYLVYGTPQGKLFLLAVPAGGNPISIGSRSGSSRDGQLSPDGGSVAYVSNESGRDEIYLDALPPKEGRVHVSASGGGTPRWSHNGRELFFAAPGGTMMAVEVQQGQTLSVGVPRELFQRNVGGVNVDYDVSADGQRFLVGQPRDSA